MPKKQTLADIGSERAVLSAICRFGNDAFIDVSDIITTDTFTINQNQLLYKIFEEVLKETSKIDIASILTKAEQLKITSLVAKEKNDLEFIRSLFNFPIHLENARNHAKRLAKIEFARKAQEHHIDAYKKLAEITGGESIDEILSISENAVFELTTEINRGKESSIELIGNESEEYVKQLKENRCENIGLPTPFPRFNEAIGGGLRRGYVDLIGARPKVGKSSLALNIGLHVAGNLKTHLLYLDSEMDRRSQTARILSRISKIDIKTIETGKFADDGSSLEAVNKARELLETIPFYHKSIAGKSFEEILSIIRRWIFKELRFTPGGQTNNCLIIYDYFKLMSISDLANMAEYQILGFRISALSDFCKMYDVPCLSFVQLNRDGAIHENAQVISASDRLVWLCGSFSILKRKEKEEIAQDGRKNGNLKLIPVECRFGAGLEQGNYINLEATKNNFTIKELNSKFEISKQNIENENDEINL